MSTSNEQKMICKNDGAPEQQDVNQPSGSSNINVVDTVAEDNDNNYLRLGGGGAMVSNKEVCTSCEQNNNDNITEGIDGIALLDMSTCANCGKEGNSNDMNTCNRCNMVKYCNAACKKKHRSKHKKKCEKRVAELYDEKLFADPPPRDNICHC